MNEIEYTPGMIFHSNEFINETFIVYWADFNSVYWAYIGTPLKIRKFWGSWKEFLPKFASVQQKYIVI